MKNDWVHHASASLDILIFLKEPISILCISRKYGSFDSNLAMVTQKDSSTRLLGDEKLSGSAFLRFQYFSVVVAFGAGRVLDETLHS